MQNSQEILDELKAISPLIAGLAKTNVFQVSEGYFNELHTRITDYAILNNSSPVENINKRNVQQVPEGYFDNLSESILAKVKAAISESAVDEIKNLSTVLYDLKNKNVFSVPVEYFDNLNNVLYNKIKEQSENAEEELRTISPLLYAIKDENVFTIPRRYFATLSDEIIDKINRPAAKVVTMKQRTSWLKYAAAAVVAGIITVTSFQLFNGSHKKTPVPDYVAASLKYKTEADVDAAIAKLDDADIARYLEKNGNVMDNEMLINNTDVSEMPSPTDYLIDDNTLNEYLNKINANASKLTP